MKSDFSDLWTRHWGKYSEPMQFNIIVNNMKDVLKHKPVEYGRDYDISISSSLEGGAIDGGLRRNCGKRRKGS